MVHWPYERKVKLNRSFYLSSTIDLSRKDEDAFEDKMSHKNCEKLFDQVNCYLIFV